MTKPVPPNPNKERTPKSLNDDNVESTPSLNVAVTCSSAQDGVHDMFSDPLHGLVLHCVVPLLLHYACKARLQAANDQATAKDAETSRLLREGLNQAGQSRECKENLAGRGHSSNGAVSNSSESLNSKAGSLTEQLQSQQK
ncbi:hypothetical protein ABBQ32_011596 [Trebouxia sp. C0010 RCD-2024]